MDDAYRIRTNQVSGEFDPSTTTDAASSGATSRDWVTGALWAALAVFVGLNAAFSIIRPDTIVFSLVFGIPGVLCLAVLVMRYLSRRHG
ncbi:hypothetical protein [Rhodococcus sp. (in: high G+C Gram-positive bacteria)]|uniref:hypothetical protein n=1 Tax=Rhodococcus sp. TaxID=1831 RepID=UPI00388FE31F